MGFFAKSLRVGWNNRGISEYIMCDYKKRFIGWYISDEEFNQNGRMDNLIPDGSWGSDFVTLGAPFDDLPKKRLQEMMDSRIHKGCGWNIISHLRRRPRDTRPPSLSVISSQELRYTFDRWWFISYKAKLVYNVYTVWSPCILMETSIRVQHF